VVVVVVDVTCVVGVGGGGAETMWDSGPVAQPEKNASTPPQAKAETSRRDARTVAGADR
jgi:hypothetical protein